MMGSDQDKLKRYEKGIESLEQLLASSGKGLSISDTSGRTIEFKAGTEEYRGVLSGIRIALAAMNMENDDE